MFYHEIIRDYFRQHYIIILTGQHDKVGGIKPVDFWDEEYTRDFVSNLYVHWTTEQYPETDGTLNPGHRRSKSAATLAASDALLRVITRLASDAATTQ